MPFTALNGRLPASVLTYLPWPEASYLRLRADAAASLGRVAVAFKRAFGRALYVSDAYRNFTQQESLKIQKGAWAATPGTSVHGLGLATDLASNINVGGSPEHRWMEANGLSFGWLNPVWAVDFDPANGEHEPWHWEYDRESDTMSALPTPTTVTTAPIWEDDEMISPEGIKQVTDIVRAEIGRQSPLFRILRRRSNGAVYLAAPDHVTVLTPAQWSTWKNLGYPTVDMDDAPLNGVLDSLRPTAPKV